MEHDEGADVHDLGVAVGMMVLGGFVLSYLFVMLVLAGVKRRGPEGVVEHLSKHGGPYTVKVPARRFAWNPAKPPGPGMWVSGPGRAKYALDDSGVVHLEFALGDGSVQSYSGPLIDRLVPTHTGRASRAVVLLVCPLFAATGLALAYFLSPGSPEARFEIALLAGIGGWIAGYFLLLLWMIARQAGSVGTRS